MISSKSFTLSLLLILGLLIFSGMKPLHQLKLSVTDIKFNDRGVEVEIKLFADDLEAALETLCAKNLPLPEGPIPQKTTICIQKYLKENFAVSVNNKVVNLNLKSTQFIPGDADNNSIKIFCYSDTQLSGVKLIKIKNTLLFNAVAEQKNIVNVHFKDETSTVKFDQDDATEKSINF